MKKCNICNATFNDSAAFCPNCGNALINEAQTPEPAVQTNVCKNCGTQLNADTAFCPACGTPKGSAPAGNGWNSVNPASQWQGYNPNGYPAGAYQTPPVKQPNPKIEKLKNNLKLILTNPGQAIDNELVDKNFITSLISGGILLISFIVMFLCLAGKADSEFGVDELYGMGIVAALFCTVFFMIIPSVTAFISSKLSGGQLNFIGALSANGLKTLYISAFLILTGFSALISIKIFAFMLLLTGMMNTFLSVSYINRVSGNTLNSAKSMWSTYAIYALLKIIATAIIYGVLSSILEDLIEGIMEELFYSSLESLF